MKTEDVHGFPQPGQPVVGEQPAAVGAQRRVDDVEIGEQLGRRQRRVRKPRSSMFGLNVEDLGRRGGQPGTDDAHCAAVWFVGAGRLVAVVGQRREFVADRHQPR